MRRIMKVQPSEHFNPMNMALETDYTARWYTPGVVDKHGYLQPAKKQVFGVAGEDEGYICPFGALGDRLWVREAWMPDAPRDGTWADVEFYGCKGSPLSMIPKRFRKPEHCIHRASWNGSEMVGWTPSIHMPRWASRITLEITGVRVERLQDISQEDAHSEGLELTGWRPTYNDPDSGGEVMTPYDNFAELWESIYGEESWQANPWVWVIDFKRLDNADKAG
ncbi:phage-related protein [Pantoea stewartii subsp. stewartii DC283]|nr:phage-related protein [Pantoea stewartii subsp. stewartii DC283]EHU02205.1 phage-related protein [Pantoea stewartii subsp. stewartii DC283]